MIVDDSEFGSMLYGADGQAIYLFDLEAADAAPLLRRVRRSVATGAHDRATRWPAVVCGRPCSAPSSAKDGTRQVTYGGHPLYFYAHEDPGQVLCHDFEDFGGTWWVVQPDGAAAP